MDVETRAIVLLFLCFVVPIATTILILIFLCRRRIFRRKRIILAWISYYTSVYAVLFYAWNGLNSLRKRCLKRKWVG